MNKYQREKEKRRKQLINLGVGYREANAILRKFAPETVDHMIKELIIIKEKKYDESDIIKGFKLIAKKLEEAAKEISRRFNI
ncbi:hypothetical protein Z962_p0091 (plasmid) [Clostridium botulinum C/D str. BKT12695]|nr:hypothetical protein Z962_p0091 [Clostridium botulinum C/D str. BKT12695]